jgi:hypothetical protein
MLSFAPACYQLPPGYTPGSNDGVFGGIPGGLRVRYDIPVEFKKPVKAVKAGQ